MIPFHPLAEIFPLIVDDDFDRLVEDVRANGVRDPIILHGGSILDGRNRYRALVALRDSGAPRGAGWGSYEGEPVTDDDLEPTAGLSWFERYSPMLNGGPLEFVVSKNLMRRHLTVSQRSMLAADLGKLGWGGDRSKSSNDVLPRDERAELAKVSPASVERADAVKEHGVPELQEAVRRGDISVAPAADVAQRPDDEQLEELARRGILPKGSRAIMSSRVEPDDSLDYFPTPPWATRALFHNVLPQAGVGPVRSAWEPACGEGHIAEILREYVVGPVYASDIFNYGYGAVFDYLAEPFTRPPEIAGVDWIVTNPPFGDAALGFVKRALAEAGEGVAMFVRSQWAVEGIERYETIFRDQPPTVCAFFVERVNLCKGRWDPDGSTATAYCWLVWIKGAQPRPTFWIPPRRRDELSLTDDAERFTTTPVTKRVIKAGADGTPIECDPVTGEVAA
jgi:hypothetical protein